MLSKPISPISTPALVAVALVLTLTGLGILSPAVHAAPSTAPEVATSEATATPASTSDASLDHLWTQWRGPFRDGRVAGEPWPDDFQCFEALWRRDLGPGYPGPIVAEDRVFVAETLDKEVEVVRALDRATGKELWNMEWTGAWEVPFFARANGSWIRSTPAYDGETLYVGGIREVLVALDGETGKMRWRRDFPKEYGTEVPPFGFASSPMVVGEHLYIQAANSIVKLDKHTGKEIWRSLANEADIMSAGAFSSPTMETLAGREQLLVQTRLELYGLDPDDGAVLWSQPVPHFRGMNILTPTVYEDTVLTSSYRNGTYLYRIGDGDGGMQSTQAWTHKATGYMSSPVIIEDHAYIHLGNGRLTCLDLKTGSERWTSKPFGKYWSKAVQDDRILALDERGELHLIQADPKAMEVLDSREISDEPTWGHLAISGEHIFVRELGAIAAYRWCDGAAAPKAAESAPAIAD